MSGRATDILLETFRINRDVSSDELRLGWRELCIDALPGLVQYEGCALWLYRRLADLDLLDSVDPTFVTFLARRARRITARNMLVATQVRRVVLVLNTLGIPHVLLKGSALRFLAGQYPYVDARLSNDVDVLVPEDRARSAWDELREAGFELPARSESYWDDHRHLPPLTDDTPVPVEFHTSTSPMLPATEAWTRITATARPLHNAGVRTAMPGPTELFWHALTHALANPRYAFRLRFFQDAALLWAADQAIDWATIAARLQGREIADSTLARRWLGAVAELAGVRRVPREIRTPTPFDLAAALRWRLMIFRGFAAGAAKRVDDPDLATRSRRLLIAEGTGAELGIRMTPPAPHAGLVTNAARRVVAVSARLCYRIWRLIDRIRARSSETTAGSAP